MLIYLVTCTVNGKVYVGKWHGKWAQQRWKIHQAHAANGASGRNYFHAAIRKYGPDAFCVEELCRASSADELIALEKFHILRLRSHLPQFGYNMTMGGEGAVANAELRQKMSQARLGRNHSPETIQKIRDGKIGALNPFHGKTHSENNRRKMASAASYLFTDEHRRKIAEALTGKANPMFGSGPMLGKQHSRETKQKMSAKTKNRWTYSRDEMLPQLEAARKIARQAPHANVNGSANPMFGKQHSEATKKKIGESTRARLKTQLNPMQGVPSPMTGKKHTPEALKKISQAKREYWAAKRAAARS